MSASAAAAAAGAVDGARVTELAAELIRCDTRNPPGDERPVVEPLRAVLRELGAEVELVEPAPGRPSVLARIGSGDSPTLLINGHVDVVPVVETEWSVPPFAGQVRDGLLYGRGACDMKGGIAAALEGVRACRDAGVVPPSSLVFHLVADEETGSLVGTEALVAAGLVRADAAVVPEPSELRVCVAERGSLLVEIVVRGRAAHGSDPAAGHSAVADAARIVSALHLVDFGAPAHPLLGSPTCNVGTVRGGTAANIVASECRLRVDRRVLPGQTREEALRTLTEAIDTAGDFDYDIEVLAFAEGSELDAGHPFVSEVRKAAGQAPVRGLYLGTDARFLRNQLGIPAVVYGPGSMTVAHAADEHVSVAELATAARTFARLYATFRGGG
ncbi:M20 family metallopeptidase [Prauserella endophytica]|uniref:Probable succinyl-diaminopimelate desuccinylase n=1 Tax=Prauserella endophytica TaxID=1592324 RepID=A0ABY2SAB1_9PSEU|nr:M20 family metallopeptidase [Prauserella endophytica]TKG72446.1 M20 family metallopeptidase [Prauserella endophytica]